MEQVLPQMPLVSLLCFLVGQQKNWLQLIDIAIYQARSTCSKVGA